MQGHSQTFTVWLCQELASYAASSTASSEHRRRSKTSITSDVDAVKQHEKGEKGDTGDRNKPTRKPQSSDSHRHHKESHRAKRSRSRRSRHRHHRRRDRSASGDRGPLPPHGGKLREIARSSPVAVDLTQSAPASAPAAEPLRPPGAFNAKGFKAVLTPNPQYADDVAPGSGQVVNGNADRWVRADPRPIPGSMPPRRPPCAPPPRPVAATLASGPAPTPQPSPAHPRQFIPVKWRVTRKDTVVREKEVINSAKVRILQAGEIVEQVSEAITLKSGVVRMQIRHPSSPQFPKPIGWVTQDATAIGGPKLFELGPQSAVPPSESLWPSQAATILLLDGLPGGALAGPRPPASAEWAAPTVYRNMTWKPSN